MVKEKAFPLRSGTRQGNLLSSCLFHIVLDILVRAIRENKRYLYCKERKLSLFPDDMIRTWKILREPPKTIEN